MRNSTPLRITTTVNASPIMHALKGIGATVEYATERTIDFILDGARMQIGHNWDDERFVFVVSMKDQKRADTLVRRVKRAVEPQPVAVEVREMEMSIY